MEALKEGWDCSFAYVLCSVANIGSATDIEQLLGRVLRMPFTQSRANPALNHAYTHVSSQRFGEGARALVDTLIQKMGLQPEEAAAGVERRQTTLPGFGAKPDLLTRRPELVETVDTAPDLNGLDTEVAGHVKVETREDGSVTVSIQGEVPEELEKRLVAAVDPAWQAAIRFGRSIRCVSLAHPANLVFRVTPLKQMASSPDGAKRSPGRSAARTPACFCVSCGPPT